jgi:hypothetical protein
VKKIEEGSWRRKRISIKFISLSIESIKNSNEAIKRLALIKQERKVNNFFLFNGKKFAENRKAEEEHRK